MEEEGKKKRGGRPRKSLMALNCTAAQYLELKRHVALINEQRATLGLSPVTLSTWILDVALREAGNFELTSLGMSLGSLARKGRREDD